MPLGAPPLSVNNLTLFATGAVSVALLPFWMNWFRYAYPEIGIRIIVSNAASQFVSIAALSHITSGGVMKDAWEAAEPGIPLHRDLAKEAEAWLVFPASLNTVSKLASGSAATPALAALQTTSAPIVIAPAMPEGADKNPIVLANLERLNSRPNVRVVAGTGSMERGLDLPKVLAVLGEHAGLVKGSRD